LIRYSRSEYGKGFDGFEEGRRVMTAFFGGRGII